MQPRPFVWLTVWMDGERFSHGGLDSYYSMFRIDGKDVAAAYTLGKDKLTQGIPPHWMLYVAPLKALTKPPAKWIHWEANC